MTGPVDPSGSAGSVASAALVAVTWLHAGFQLVVTALVYPALLAPTTDAAAWAERHDRHSRRIAPVVGVVYGALVVGGAWALIAAPRSWAAWLSVAAAATAVACTAAVAAPVHGRLGRGRDERLERRLVRVDRLRLALAVGAAVLAAVAVLSD